MKYFKESLYGCVLILYGHGLFVGILMLWTSYLPFLWDKSMWIPIGVAVLMPFILYGVIGFTIARFIRNLRSIRPGAILFGSIMLFGFIIAVYMQSRNIAQVLDWYTIANYPIGAFYRNAPDYGYITGSAILASFFMAYLGLINGFALQRRILRAREGKKR
jgi:hypothetical protein